MFSRPGATKPRRVNSSGVQDPEQLEPLVPKAQLAEVVALAQLGFAAVPRGLLVLVQRPDQVNSFLVSCDDLI